MLPNLLLRCPWTRWIYIATKFEANHASQSQDTSEQNFEIISLPDFFLILLHFAHLTFSAITCEHMVLSSWNLAHIKGLLKHISVPILVGIRIKFTELVLMSDVARITTYQETFNSASCIFCWKKVIISDNERLFMMDLVLLGVMIRTYVCIEKVYSHFSNAYRNMLHQKYRPHKLNF